MKSMKKVIRGRVYNTATASEIGSTSGTGETLYRKRTGEYFLYCFGGAMSKYGAWHGNTGESGTAIKPLAYDEAKEWAEKALDGEEWLAEFGNLEENGDRTTLNISITVGAADIVKRAAQKKGKSVSETIEVLIRENLA